MGEKSTSSTESKTASLNAILSGAAISFLGFAILRIAGLGEKVLIARFFDPSRYGQIVLAISVLSLASMLGLVGLRTGVVRYISRYDSRQSQRIIVNNSIIISMISSLLLAAGLFLSAEWVALTVFNDVELVPLLGIVAFGIPVAVFGKLGASIARGLKDARANTIIKNITPSLSRVLLIVLAIALGLGTVGVAYAYVGGFLLMAVISGVYIYINFGPPFSSDNKFGQLLRFSVPLLFADSMQFITSTLDTILIGFFLTAHSVGIYNASYPLARLVFLAPGLLVVIFNPVISELHSEDDFESIREIYRIVARWVVILTLPGVFLLVARPEIFINFVFGNRYEAGSTVLVILSLAFFYHVLLGINGGTLNMLGQSRFFLFSTSVNAGVNVVLNIWLIPRIGIEGAALATAVSYIVGNTLISHRLYRDFQIHPFGTKNFSSYLIYLPIITIFYFIIARIVTGFWLVLVTYVTALLGFLIVYWWSDIPVPEERDIIQEYVEKALSS